MKNKLVRLLQWSLVPLFDTGNQIFMKLLGLKIGDIAFGISWLTQASASPYLWGAFACDAGSFIAWMMILRRTNVSLAVPVSSICYVTIIIASWLVFHEATTFPQLAGIFLIVAGIICMNFDKKV